MRRLCQVRHYGTVSAVLAIAESGYASGMRLSPVRRHEHYVVRPLHGVAGFSTVLATLFLSLLVASPAAARVREQPSRMEEGLLSVARYGQPTVYSGILQSAQGPAAVFAYGDPEKIDVWSYRTGAWSKAVTLTPGAGAVTTTPSFVSKDAFVVMALPGLTVNLTVPVILPGGHGLAVLAYRNGAWALLPFLPATGPPTSFVGVGSVVVKDREIVSTAACPSGCQTAVTQISTVWHFDRRRQTFVPLVGSVAATPLARANAAMAYDPATNQLVMVGGYRSENPASLHDTWVWDGDAWHEASAGQSVDNLNEPGAIGPSASGSDLVYDARTRQLLLVETTPNGSGNYSDTWTWDGSRWTRLTYASTPPQFADAAAYDPPTGEVVLLVAGRTPVQAYAALPPTETWLWNGSTWRQAHPAHPAPDSAGAPLAYDPNSGEVILQGSGGVTNEGFGPLSTDTWAWNGTDWSRIHTSNAPPPSPYAVMAYDSGNQHLWLLDTGGHIDSGCGIGLAPHVDRIYVWNGKDWSFRPAPGGLRSRQEATMAYDPATKQLVLFGGCTIETGSSTLSDETQIIDGPQAGQVPIQAQAGGSGTKCDGLIDSGLGFAVEPSWVGHINDQLQKAAYNLRGSHGLPVPLGSVNLRAGLALNWTPHFDPDEAKLCALGLTGELADPLWTPPGDDLSLNLQHSAGGGLPGVTYSADATSWTSAPDAPAGEPLSTTWLPQAHLFSGPAVTLSENGLSAEVNLAEIDLVSVPLKTTLLVQGKDVLEAEIGPKLAIELSVGKKNLLDELAKKIKALDDGPAPSSDEIATAEREVAQEVANETAAEVQGFETGYLQETVVQSAAASDATSVIDAVQSQVEGELADEVAGLQPGSSDLAELDSAGVTPEELSPDAAALLEGGASGSDAVLGGGRLLCIGVFGGPEDIFGDIFCEVA